MGCDIHLHIEVKINDEWLHYNSPHVSRHYAVFAKMANVRNYDDNEIVPISAPKGMPPDASRVTVFDFYEWDLDGHSYSWLSASEIAVLANWMKEQSWGSSPFYFEDVFGFLFGNSYPGFTKYPEDRPEGLQDVRFVFWFDN